MAELIARGWLFSHPDLDGGPVAGLRLSNRGGIAQVRGDGLIRQAIFLLLSTRCGERVMRPSYGSELHKLVFLPNDVTTAGLAIHYTQRALERWEPRIEVLAVDAGPRERDPQYLEISLEYRVVASGTHDELHFAVALSGEEG